MKACFTRRPLRASRNRRPCLENLEERALLSGVHVGHVAHGPTAIDRQWPAALVNTETAKAGRSFTAILTGSNFVPASGDTGSGKATLTLNKKGTTLSYQDVLKNPNYSGFNYSAFFDSLYLGRAGQVGPIVASGPRRVVLGHPKRIFDGFDISTNGVVGIGLLTGPLAGHPLSDLIAQIRAGNVYVEVSSPRPDIAPLPALRGQIRVGR